MLRSSPTELFMRALIGESGDGEIFTVRASDGGDRLGRFHRGLEIDLTRVQWLASSAARHAPLDACHMIDTSVGEAW